MAKLEMAMAIKTLPKIEMAMTKKTGKHGDGDGGDGRGPSSWKVKPWSKQASPYVRCNVCRKVSFVYRTSPIRTAVVQHCRNRRCVQNGGKDKGQLQDCVWGKINGIFLGKQTPFLLVSLLEGIQSLRNKVPGKFFGKFLEK